VSALKASVVPGGLGCWTFGFSGGTQSFPLLQFRLLDPRSGSGGHPAASELGGVPENGVARVFLRFLFPEASFYAALIVSWRNHSSVKDAMQVRAEGRTPTLQITWGPSFLSHLFPRAAFLLCVLARVWVASLHVKSALRELSIGAPLILSFLSLSPLLSSFCQRGGVLFTGGPRSSVQCSAG